MVVMVAISLCTANLKNDSIVVLCDSWLASWTTILLDLWRFVGFVFHDDGVVSLLPAAFRCNHVFYFFVRHVFFGNRHLERA